MPLILSCRRSTNIIKMKRLFVIILSISAISIKAQEASNDAVVIANEDSCSTEGIQSAIDACLLLAESAETKDPDALREAMTAMQECRLADFNLLRKQNSDENESLKGHLVFNAAFANSLAEGKDPYPYADNINKSTAHRGQMPPGQIYTKTCFVKANGKSVYTFISRDRQELAIVAEPGGLVTTRVHAVNDETGVNEWHNDTVDVTKGRRSRKSAFMLPHSSNSQITLEITNCTNKDISVVVISN